MNVIKMDPEDLDRYEIKLGELIRMIENMRLKTDLYFSLLEERDRLVDLHNDMEMIRFKEMNVEMENMHVA
jgi:hypothetical protein